MKLLFKQRFFSWFDSYDIYDEAGNVAFTVKGELAWGHCLRIFDAQGQELGLVKEKVLTFLPKFELYAFGQYIGCIEKEFALFRSSFTMDVNGWSIDGGFLEWDYQIIDSACRPVATISKELFQWTDTYVLNIARPEDALSVLMVALAIDAENCSND